MENSLNATSNAPQVPHGTHKAATSNGHAQNGVAPNPETLDLEEQLLATMRHCKGVIDPVCLQKRPLSRADFLNPIAGCVYGAAADAAREGGPATVSADVLSTLQEWAREGENVPLATEGAALWKLLKKPDVAPADAKSRVLALAKEIQERAASTRAPKAKKKQLASTCEEIPPFEFFFSTDSDLDERLGEIEWLWPGYIPRGFVTAIVGDQDQGKSQVAQNLCDTILRGVRWPDGQPHAPQADTKLLWIDTEGSIALFHQRAKAWGMPRGRFVLPPDPLQELTVDDFEHWMWIEAAIEKFQPPIVVIDALSGAHKSGKENGNDEMKPVMKKLAGLAQQYNIAVVVVHHLNKPVQGMASYPISIHRLRGASAISQYCRSILALGIPDANRPENRRLDVIKLNLAPKPPSVGYELTNSGPTWGDAPEPPKERRAIDDALDFLEIAMQSGPRPAAEIQEEAKAQKIGGNALRDAMKAMKIKPRREGGSEGRWFWYPPDFAKFDGEEVTL